MLANYFILAIGIVALIITVPRFRKSPRVTAFHMLWSGSLCACAALGIWFHTLLPQRAVQSENLTRIMIVQKFLAGVATGSVLACLVLYERVPSK